MPKHSITTLVRVPFVYPWSGGVSVSPDGAHAALAWNKNGQWEIWLAPLAGGRPKQITGGAESKHAPRFSPDGRALAYLQDHDGDEKYDVFIYDLATGATRNAMPDTPDALLDRYSWSPDSRHVALTANRGGRFAVHTLDTHTGQLRRLTDHSYSDLEPAWSPDGKWIAFSAITAGQDTGLFIVPAEGGPARRVADVFGPLDAHTPRWSPDGAQLAFVGRPRGNADIGVMDASTGNIRWVANEKWDEENPAWSPDGRSLAYTINRDGNVSLVVVDLKKGRRHRAAIEAGYHEAPLFAPDGSLLTVFQSARRPADLWRLDRVGGKWTQITQSLPRAVKPTDFLMPRVMRWKAPDGLAISGLCFQPKGKAARRPALLNVHGGPSWQFMNVWSPLVQVWVSEGWAVLCPNYRGSTGYGKAFQTANRFALGQADIADIVAGADTLVRKGLARPDRIGITGGSYGGYMTMIGLTQYPDRFAVGSAIVPFLNWFTEFETEREDLRYWDLQNMGDPKADAARYRESSPIFFLDRIAAPVQMLAGANDPRCPAAETQQAVDELTRLGKVHEAIIFPDEGHGFLKLTNKLTAYRRQLKFLRKYLE